MGLTGGACAAAPVEPSFELDVEITGVEDELQENIRLVLSTARLAAEDEDVTERAARAAHARAPDEIRDALEPFGYYRPRVRSSLRRDGEVLRARYHVDPGPPLRLDEVDVGASGPGARDPRLRALIEDFPLAQGDRLVHPDYEAGKSALLDYAARNGYVEAEFSPAEIRIDRERYTSEIELRLETGPRYYFGPVTFRQDVLDRDVLEGFVNFRPGQPFNINRLQRFQNALSDTEYFSRVEVRAEPDAAVGGRIPVEVHLEPARRRRWSAGLGYGTDTGPRATGELDLNRINRRGHRGRASATVSAIEQSFEARYIIPLRRARSDALTFATGYGNLSPTTSDQELALVSGTVTRRRRGWQWSWGLAFRREDYRVGSDSGLADLLVPEATLTRTRADDRVYPTRGFRLDLRARGAEEAALSDTSFVRFSTRLQGVYGLVDGVRVLGRVEAGVMSAPDFRRLPASQRFFAGGDQSIRGFDYQAIGELDETGQVIGGTRLLTASLELDWLFFEKFGRWGLAAFADAGDAGTDLDWFERRGAGLGIRWLSPVGMVRIDGAIAISEPDRPWRLHLSLGPDL